MPKPTVLIVDDELPARQLLRELIESDGRFVVLGECDGGAKAIQVASALAPDLLLLDIQMPEVDGFDVLASLGTDAPVTIMVTAFNEHALRAFDFHALDYVLKPIEERRLGLALTRALVRLEEASPPERSPAGSLLADLDGSREGVALTAPEAMDERIVLKCGSAIVFLLQGEIDLIEAAGNYLKVQAKGETHLVRLSISRLLERLHGELFLRIHRSFVVNRTRVQEVRPLAGSYDYSVVLTDGSTLPIGRSYRKQVLDRLSD